MRILHIITNTDLGGAQRVVIDLCTMAVNDGHTAAVASMQGGPMWEQLPEQVEKFVLPHMVKPIKPLKELPCLLEIRKTIKTFSPDIIHLHSSKAALLGRIAAPHRLRKRIVYTVHGFDTIRVRNRIFLPLEKLFQKRCGAIVPVSEYDYRNLLSEKINHNLVLIKNAVPDKPAFKESELPASFLKPLTEARSTGKKIILTIARIALPKRLDVFAETARQLKDENCIFVWVGAPTDSTLTGQLAEIEKQGNVFFTGDIPDASRLISYCDIFVLFSNYEGLPITILEALSKGKPVIASSAGGIPELVDDRNGKLINNDNAVPEAVEAIRELTHDYSLYMAKCKASRDRYDSEFCLNLMWDKYSSTYQTLKNLI